MNIDIYIFYLPIACKTLYKEDMQRKVIENVLTWKKANHIVMQTFRCIAINLRRLTKEHRTALVYMCYHSAKLWNQALFLLNKKEAKLNFYDLYNRLRSSVHLRALQSRASQIILDELVRAYKKHLEYQSIAKPKPRRKHRTVIFDKTGFKVCGSRIRVSLSRSLRKHLKEKHGIDLRYLWLETSLPLNEKAIKNVQIVPKGDEFELHLIYEAEINPIDFNGSKVMTIDPGSSNFFAIVVEGVETPYIIDGKGLKSLLRKYLKKIAKLQSLKDNLKNKGLPFHNVEKKIKKLWVKIHRLLRNFAHTVSNLVLELALRHNVKEIRVGDGFQNKNRESNLNSIAEQMWHLLPHGKAFEYLKYKAEELGIFVDTISEDYSSGVDSLLNKAVAEESCIPELRVKRGLFKSVLGFINADVNACRSLLKKLGIFDKISGLAKPIRLRIFHKFKGSSAYEMGRSRGRVYQAVGIRLLARANSSRSPYKGVVH